MHKYSNFDSERNTLNGTGTVGEGVMIMPIK